MLKVASVQFSCSVMSNSLWPHGLHAARQTSLSITNSQSLLKLMSIESMMSSNHLILCHPLLLLPSIFPSIRVFSNESVLRVRWPKYWSLSFSITPSNEHSGLISFRMDWLDLLAVQGTLKSPLQHHSAKASILQLNLPYWSTVDWQCCVSLRYIAQHKVCVCFYTHTHTHTYILFQMLFPYMLLQNIEYSSLCYIVGPCW